MTQKNPCNLTIAGISILELLQIRRLLRSVNEHSYAVEVVLLRELIG